MEWISTEVRPETPIRLFVETKEGDKALYSYTGSDISYMCLMDQYHRYLVESTPSKESCQQVPLTCMYCQMDFYGEEPKGCCDGRECGCMGQPTEPVVCSKGCYEMLKQKNQSPTPVTEVQESEIETWLKVEYPALHDNRSLLKDTHGAVSEIIKHFISYYLPQTHPRN